jgi:hypothetical protein
MKEREHQQEKAADLGSEILDDSSESTLVMSAPPPEEEEDHERRLAEIQQGTFPDFIA